MQVAIRLRFLEDIGVLAGGGHGVLQCWCSSTSIRNRRCASGATGLSDPNNRHELGVE